MDLEKIFRHFQSNKDNCYVNEIFLLIKRFKISPQADSRFQNIAINTTFALSIGASIILMIINLPFIKNYNYNKKIAIARVFSEKYKIQNLSRTMQFVEDDIKNFDFTLYRIGSRYGRLSYIFKYFIKNCIVDFDELKKILKINDLDNYRAPILRAYAKRIPHTIIFKYAIEHIVSCYNLNAIYTAANCERFGVVAQEISRKYNKKLVCIPHGIETADEVPAGYVGDVFYATSQVMANTLNELYGTKKFIFNDKINTKMYRIKEAIKNGCKPYKVVFFTHPTYKISLENIVEEIAAHLENKGEKLYIKVHPREKALKYQTKNSEFIDDIKFALVGNLCISFYSTVLLEAIYNESQVVSIINLFKDGEEFDGDYEFLVHLKDDRIYKPKDKDALFELIDIYLQDKKSNVSYSID